MIPYEEPQKVVSLPSRERGLKYANELKSGIPGQSLPSRERGLKYNILALETDHLQSLPSRERGLK